MKRFGYILCAISGLSASAAFAQTDASTSGPQFVITPSPATAPYLSGVDLRPQTVNDVTYLCGGVGQDEQQKINSRASKYDLMMTFSASNGAYLAGVDVEIANAKGDAVFSANCDGPILLVDLPKGGKYTVRAQAEGKTVTRSARLSERGPVKRMNLTWPTNTVEMGQSPSIRMQGNGSETRSGASGTGRSEAGR